MDYSVLMSVYAKEIPAHLESAIESILSQTVPASQFVVVCDGPLTPALDEVISRYKDRLDVLRLPKNIGLALALNKGLAHCRHELVARMDSDDISLSDRCAKQLAAFEQDSELVMLSGVVEEFCEDPGQTHARRVVPLTHEEILRYSKRRSPFNHVAVMFKRSVILRLGGYDGAFTLYEDYDLWFRVLQSGAKTANLPDTLVKVRAPADQIKRRGGLHYGKQVFRFRKKMYKAGWTSRREFIFSAYPHLIICIMPNFVRVFIYKLLRREPKS